VVVGYKLDGKMLEVGQVPPPWRVSEVEPIMEEWEGFEENIFGISNYADLPKNAQAFIQKIESMTGVKLLLIGTGPERDAIVVNN
jgi:adenylosuccinate synthase